MQTECTQTSFGFQPLGRRQVVEQFDCGEIIRDGGGLLLREVENRTGIVRQLATCFVDHRQGERVEHTVEELVGQRVFGLALGYEDLNDHDQLRLYFSAVAYLVLQALRRLGLAGTEMARAQCQTMRLKLLKIGAQIRITVRKVWVSLAGGYPHAGLFAQVYANLQPVPALRC